jgi:glycosyltransferase involved in cell wall biosynthesis
MKIILVTNGFPPTAYGGVEVYSYDLARGLAERGHEIIVFCRETLDSQPDYVVMDDVVDGIRVLRVVNDFKALTHFRQTYADETVEQLFEHYLAELFPDLVHFHHLIALSANLPQVATRRGIPHVTTLHDYWPICHRVNLIHRDQRICAGPLAGGICRPCVFGSPRKNLIWWMLALAKKVTPAAARQSLRRRVARGDARTPVVDISRTGVDFDLRHTIFRQNILTSRRLFVPSHYVRDQFVHNAYPSERIEVLPLGISPLARLPAAQVPPQKLRLAFVGSLIPIKGADVLLRALAQVPGDYLSLDIYGREDIEPAGYVTRLKKLAQRDRRVTLRGAFPPAQRGQVYAAIDALVIPSVAPETFSLAAREALSSGKPVIASAIGALPEVVREGVNGYLFEPGNVNQLAALLTRLARQPESLSRLECPGPVEILSVAEHTLRIEAIYNQVLG